MPDNFVAYPFTILGPNDKRSVLVVSWNIFFYRVCFLKNTAASSNSSFLQKVVFDAHTKVFQATVYALFLLFSSARLVFCKCSPDFDTERWSVDM